MYEKILYPIKFDEFSLDVLLCILNFKKAGTEEIVLLHVVDVSKLPAEYEGYSLRDVNTLKEIADAKLGDAVRMIENAGLRVKKRIECGVTYKEILKVAGEENVSLIISGRMRKSILGEIFIGSNTDKVIRYGNIPVYIPKYPILFGADKKTNENFCEKLFSRVLYPTDWSDCAVEALRYLKGLKEAGVEEVIIARVIDEKTVRFLDSEKFREIERIDREKIEKVREDLENEGFRVKIRLQIGKPGAVLIKIAKEEEASLIVMGSHGRGSIEGIIWGSVSRNVVEYSDRPVLVIKGINLQQKKLND